MSGRVGAGPGHLPAEGAGERSPEGGAWSTCRSRDPAGPREGETPGGEAPERAPPRGLAGSLRDLGFIHIEEPGEFRVRGRGVTYLPFKMISLGGEGIEGE